MSAYRIDLTPQLAEAKKLLQLLQDLHGQEFPPDARASNSDEQKQRVRIRADLRNDIQFAGHLAQTISTEVNSVIHEERGFYPTRRTA